MKVLGEILLANSSPCLNMGISSNSYYNPGKNYCGQRARIKI